MNRFRDGNDVNATLGGEKHSARSVARTLDQLADTYSDLRIAEQFKGRHR